MGGRVGDGAQLLGYFSYMMYEVFKFTKVFYWNELSMEHNLWKEALQQDESYLGQIIC